MAFSLVTRVAYLAILVCTWLLAECIFDEGLSSTLQLTEAERLSQTSVDLTVDLECEVQEARLRINLMNKEQQSEDVDASIEVICHLLPS